MPNGCEMLEQSRDPLAELERRDDLPGPSGSARGREVVADLTFEFDLELPVDFGTERGEIGVAAGTGDEIEPVA